MKNNVIIGVVIAIIILGVVVFFFGKIGSHPMIQVVPTLSHMSQQPTSSAMTKNSVTIKNFSFSPATITVKVGDKVTWTNEDTAGHSATADDGSFDTGVLSQGQVGSFLFSKAGTFTYHCSVHPNMKATIVVTQK